MARVSDADFDMIRDELSTASPGGDVPTDLPTLFVGPGDSGDPTEAMDRYEDRGALTGVTFPADRPPYYMKIDLQTYKRTSWREIADVTPHASLILPVPQNLVDTYAVDWTGEELGMTGAVAMNGISALSGGGDGMFAGVSGAINQLGRRTLGSLAPGISGGVQASMGWALNNYLTIMMKGPTYKRHSFSWNLAPSNAAESETIMRMRRMVLEAQAPELTAAGAFFDYPNVFRLGFFHQDQELGDQLYRFKPCVLASSSWNFTPAAAPAFFAGSHAPETVQVRLDFIELELWLASDYRSA